MPAVAFQGPGQVALETVEDPVIQEPTDAIVRITTSALCRSDLHMYEGRGPGMVTWRSFSAGLKQKDARARSRASSC